MPTVDRDSNAQKAHTDRLARELLRPDRAAQKKMLRRIVTQLSSEWSPIRLVVTGGAGSGKSSAAKELAHELGLPVLDFDKYIPGGWTKDRKVYEKRLLNGMDNLWGDLPVKTGWIVEHVEACNENMLKAFHPTHALLIQPTTKQVLQVAAARAAASGEDEAGFHGRRSRALESAEYARMQFEAAVGKMLDQGLGWFLKKLA